MYFYNWLCYSIQKRQRYNNPQHTRYLLEVAGVSDGSSREDRLHTRLAGISCQSACVFHGQHLRLCWLSNSQSASSKCWLAEDYIVHYCIIVVKVVKLKGLSHHKCMITGSLTAGPPITIMGVPESPWMAQRSSMYTAALFNLCGNDQDSQPVL